MRIIKILFASTLLLIGTTHRAAAQYYGVRVNALALATGTLNAGFETMLGDKYTLDLSAYWNPIKAPGLQAQVLAFQPGIRRWLYEAYTGHFWAAHLAVARYDVGNDR